MIIVLFGQPNCGKSTLAKRLTEDRGYNIDGDELRRIFKNNDYSRKGRIKNLNRASDVAHYMHSISGEDIVLSLVYPFKEAREHLNNLTQDVKWIYLTYTGIRGREEFHLKEFEEPVDEQVLHLNTSELTINQCIDAIKVYINEEHISKSSE
jgi:adenylylsulfate kinase-like enzyme